MSFLDALILGVVEGVTEFLPISSTGHLILTSKLFAIVQSEFVKSFEIIIQLGAILSVVFLYWRTILNKNTLKKIIVGFVPTGVVGLLFYKIIKTYLIGNETVVVWTLLIGGAALIIFELWYKEPTEAAEDLDQVSYKQSFIIGLCQSVAIIPGVSRSAATILGGLGLGLRRRTIVEFSFLLAIPTMFAATGLDLIKNAGAFSVDQLGVLIVGFVTSFVVALGSIKFLMRFIQHHNFIPFGVYRILAAVAFWFFIIRG